MGIRGAWSLLSKDPRRYGLPWTLRNDDDDIGTETILFVDGPSLLYHLATDDAYDDEPSSESRSEMMHRKPHEVSPDIIYHRTMVFVSSLFSSAGGLLEVHIVMDGLAPASKMPTQTSRLRTMAMRCEGIAVSRHGSNGSKDIVLNIFAEAAMVEALNEMKQGRRHGLHIHHPHHGEAEAFIAQWLDRHQTKKEVVILTDDTDFLVYPSCVGLVPFRTLQFQTVAGKTHVSGFQYLRRKFLASFLPSSMESDEYIMTTVACLAGCDYILSSSRESLLQRARTHVVQSDIGGLRQRQRNNPSSASLLTAILRFVASCIRKQLLQHKGSETCIPTMWLRSMASSITGKSKGHEQRTEQLLEVFDEIHNTYFPSAAADCLLNRDPSRPLLSTGYSRLAEYGVVFCPPVVETWGGGNSSTQSRKRKPRRTTRSSKISRVQQGDTVALDEELCCDNLPSEGGIKMPPSTAMVSSWVAKGSIWKLPHFCRVRMRLYSELRQCAESMKRDLARLCFHPLWLSPHPIITEYLRVGTSKTIDYKAFPTDIESGDCHDGLGRTTTECSELTPKLRSIYSVTFRCILDRHIEESDLMPVPPKYAMLFISSLMLPPSCALHLLLVGTIPLQLTAEFQTCFSTEAGAMYNVNLSLTTVACFHVALVLNAASHIVENTEGNLVVGDEASDWNNVLEGFCVHRIFQKDTAMWIYKLLDERKPAGSDQDEASNERLDAFFCCLQTQQSKMKSSTTFVEQWQKESYCLWKKWRDVYQSAGHL